MRIYIVEDDADIRGMMTYALRNSGYEVEGFGDGKSFFEAVGARTPDLVLLDILLPGEDGLSLLSALRARPETKDLPIMMVTAKTTELDKVTGLDLGADDYLPKPFHLAELIARVKSVIRRNHHAGATYIEYGNIRIDPDHFQVFVAGTPIELNRKEYDILLYFIQRPERVINKMTLAESVWGDHIDQVDNFDFIYAQVKNLRKKLTEAGANAEVKAVYGFGYKMSLQAL